MVNDKQACNAHCAHCYIPYDGVREPQAVASLVDRLRSNYQILIAGSETLVDVRYLEAYEKAGQQYILTNGILLHSQPRLYERLKEHGINELRVSCHFSVQQALHSVPLSIVSDVVRKAKERAFHVVLFTTVIAKNHKEIREMCDQASEMGADGIKFINYVKSGRARGEGRCILGKDQKENVFRTVVEARESYSREVLNIQLHGNFGPRAGSKGEAMAARNEYCPAGRNLFVLHPNDQVSACPFLMDHPIGALLDGTNLRINRGLNEGQRRECLIDFLSDAEGVVESPLPHSP